ncbi:MAG: hypothetical protein NC548_27815 [Lachnospiraceae bacterium]|nr:hypothetical protein [Lachnospiraceae bacterium]
MAKSMTTNDLLAARHTPENRALVAEMESLAQELGALADIHQTPAVLFTNDVIRDKAIDFCMEMAKPALDHFANAYGGGSSKHEQEYVFLESLTDSDDEVAMPVPTQEAHEANIRQLMENSFMDSRMANANQRNLNELTPFDAFLPFAIIRSYLPMVANQVFPYVVPAKDFIRIKYHYKYIVTKDNQKLLRPDVYADMNKVFDILNSAKGPRVTADFYPVGEEVASEADADYTSVDGKFYKVPTDPMNITDFDLLGESGGIPQHGDALDVNVCISAARGVVTDSQGTTHVVELGDLEIYPDVTSISPQRSISYVLRYPITRDDGTQEGIVEDRLYGEYNAREATINLTSLTGTTKQVQFGGNLSNKTNREYLSYTEDFAFQSHPIEEGYTGNVPITIEDMNLYKQCGDQDILANAVNEFTEMFSQLEDTSCFAYTNQKFNAYADKGNQHGFVHFDKGPVVFQRTVNVKWESTMYMKQNEYVQDRVEAAIAAMIRKMTDTCANEPFRLVAIAHPNVASLFVGDNLNWDIKPGSTMMEGIRTDFNMGIKTCAGHTFRLVTSQKFPEKDGVRFYLYPVNEQNFLTWKHFKYNIWFSNQYQTQDMPGIPNIRCISRFKTQSYTPLQGRLLIEGYYDI